MHIKIKKWQNMDFWKKHSGKVFSQNENRTFLKMSDFKKKLLIIESGWAELQKP